MKLRALNEPFTCAHCSRRVEPIKHGTCRDHCPFCLYGMHVDDVLPGDRASTCKGLLRPVGLSSSPKKGYVISYQCERCGTERVNKAAEDDDYDVLLSVSNPLRG